MKIIAIVLGLAFAGSILHAEEVYRVKVGKGDGSYTNDDLRRRVWELERAVNQLQRRIYDLESENRPLAVHVGQTNVASNSDTWVCTITAMGNRFTGTGGSKAVAVAKSTESCKSGNNGDGFFCKDPECTQ